jgi:hypothetical protein
MCKLTRNVRSALLVGALVIAPAAARAATIMEPFTIALPSIPGFLGRFDSGFFPQFDPTLGTLNDVTMSVTGSGTWTATVMGDLLSAQLDGRQGFASNIQIFNSGGSGSMPVHFNLSGTTNAAIVLAAWTGPGVNFVSLNLGGGAVGDTIQSGGSPLIGTFTFDYTPTAAVPEPSTWAMMLLGFAGLGFAFRQSRRKLSFE